MKLAIIFLVLGAMMAGATGEITLRKSGERGHIQADWLNTYHTFSFGQYLDPRYMGFRALRVINEDTVAAGEGFPMHSHKEMEIITYVLEGALEHQDSMGNRGVISEGEVQRMSAGSGARHSEFNPSKEAPVHLFQIWIEPNRAALSPSYEQKRFSKEAKSNTLCLIASPDGASGSIKIHQEARLYGCELDKERSVSLDVKPSHGVWVQVASGRVKVNGMRLETGDGASVEGCSRVTFEAEEKAHFIVIDLV